MSLMVNTNFKEKPECPKTITLEKPHLNPWGWARRASVLRFLAMSIMGWSSIEYSSSSDLRLSSAAY